MRRIRLINPNTTQAMTDACVESIQPLFDDQTCLDGVTAKSGPQSIEGHFDGALGAIGLLEAIAEDTLADGYIVACFDDTGLDAARCMVSAPVIGIGEAAFHFASMLANRFAVITTLSRSVPILEDNLQRYGLDKRCAAVLATDISVLDLESGKTDVESLMEEKIRHAQSLGAEAIVLGCAGMTRMTRRLSDKFNMPVVDGVTAAAAIVRGLTDVGLKTSKVGGYATPNPKKHGGMLSAFDLSKK